jgi:hypothetical protein
LRVNGTTVEIIGKAGVSREDFTSSFGDCALICLSLCSTSHL